MMTLLWTALAACLASEGQGRTAIVPTPASTVLLLDVDDLLRLEVPEGIAAKETPEQEKARETDSFAEILRGWMKPAFDPAIDRLEIVSPGHLCLVAGAEKTSWAQRFCDLQRSWKEYVFVETNTWDCPRGTMKRFGFENGTRILERRADLDALAARIKEEPNCDFLVAPKLLSLPRQKASMFAGEPVCYVQDWRTEVVEPGARSIAVPTIGQLFDGVEIEARAFPLEDGVLGLELRFTTTKVERPIPTKKVRLGGVDGQDLEVALPVARKVHLDTHVSLAEGASIVLVGTAADADREIAVTVTLRRSEGGAPPKESSATPK